MEFSVDKAIEILQATPRTLHALLGDVSDEWIAGIQNPKSKIQNGPWEPFDVVGHLIHGEQTDWIPRVRIILEQGDDRTFVPFDRFAQFELSKGKSLVELLSEFERVGSEKIARLVAWNFSEEQIVLEGSNQVLGSV